MGKHQSSIPNVGKLAYIVQRNSERDWCVLSLSNHGIGLFNDRHVFCLKSINSWFHLRQIKSTAWFNTVKCNKYSGAKKYLVSHQLCKFSHLKR
jgi:hypothetical protein